MVQTSDEAAQSVVHWDRARFESEMVGHRTNIHPEHWPDDVRTISLEGLSFLGLDSKGHLYLDGEPVYTVKRWGRTERWLACLGIAAAWVGAGATVVQAWVACCAAQL